MWCNIDVDPVILKPFINFLLRLNVPELRRNWDMACNISHLHNADTYIALEWHHMSALESQITVTGLFLQRNARAKAKESSKICITFVRGFHPWIVDFHRKVPLMPIMFPCKAHKYHGVEGPQRIFRQHYISSGWHNNSSIQDITEITLYGRFSNISVWYTYSWYPIRTPYIHTFYLIQIIFQFILLFLMLCGWLPKVIRMPQP